MHARSTLLWRRYSCANYCRGSLPKSWWKSSNRRVGVWKYCLRPQRCTRVSTTPVQTATWSAVSMSSMCYPKWPCSKTKNLQKIQTRSQMKGKETANSRKKKKPRPKSQLIQLKRRICLPTDQLCGSCWWGVWLNTLTVIKRKFFTKSLLQIHYFT